MIEFILQSKIKYFVLGVVAVCFVIVFLTSSFSEEDEVAQIEAHMQMMEANRRQHIAAMRANNKKPPGLIIGEGEFKNQEPRPPDFDVKFYSGKEMVKVVDGEKTQFQIHEVTIENVAEGDIRLECKDSFSKFGEILAPGGHYKFKVTDIFHKRHYWCIAHDVNFDEVKYTFKAYGEGAPRDNNHITLRNDGAFINGKNVNIEPEVGAKGKPAVAVLKGKVDHPNVNSNT